MSLWYVSGYAGSVYLFICPCGMCHGMYVLSIYLSVLVVCVTVCRLCLFIYLSLWYVSAYVGSVYFFVFLVVCVRVCRLCVFLCLSCGMCQGM